VKKQAESSRDKQQRILLAIRLFWRANGFAPSLREICTAAEISSTSVAVWHLEQLQDAGLVQYEAGKPRTIRLTHKEEKTWTA
jgi:repressor LexA